MVQSLQKFKTLAEDPSLMDSFLYEAVFEENPHVKQVKLKELLDILQNLNYRGASIYPLYKRFSEKFPGFTVPAFNIRGMTYDVARRIFRVAKRLRVGTFIFEIAKSEIGYTKQRPLEYAVVILSAAFREGFDGPVFLQGDHFQLNRKSFYGDAQAEKEALKKLILEALSAQFYNIDIDASTLVNLEVSDLLEQQRPNFEVTAELAEFIRDQEPREITVNLGGEIGEIGGRNSTPEELRAFMKGFTESFRGEVGLSKISVQTGTTHGGVVLPDGRVAEVALDFETLKTLSRIAREEFGLAGAVQHGASTLPEEAFYKFPEEECIEVHLATGFQNFLYDHPALPMSFREKIYAYLKENFKSEWKEGLTEAQFLYKIRKKGFGAFKREWWDLPAEIKEHILGDMEGLFEKIFKALNVINTEGVVREAFQVN
ncbi:MAG: class II fructose-bisphosphate aldolase [Caldimicrobium sp.]|nr:class II fructose-bisphosphate aldolase [Caldimicrobium sp.]MCX7874010.1 class II fructose-bisphosphate aldolase [Caldimicrobium sp.]MDW8094158.1 class II fructose-bisphosphate aldolase [Caldimicrobium sp.]